MKKQMIEGAFHVLNYWAYTLNFEVKNEKKISNVITLVDINIYKNIKNKFFCFL